MSSSQPHPSPNALLGDRFKKKYPEHHQDGGRLFPINPINPVGSNSPSIGHSLYRVPEYNEPPYENQSHHSNHPNPRISHKRSLSKDSYKRPAPYIASGGGNGSSTLQDPLSPVQEQIHSGYNSLPQHYPKSRPQNKPHVDEQLAHSDVEQSPLQLHQKYGSLPSKAKKGKKDAAQNLLDYCDALLADLEKAASS